MLSTLGYLIKNKLSTILGRTLNKQHTMSSSGLSLT